MNHPNVLQLSPLDQERIDNFIERMGNAASSLNTVMAQIEDLIEFFQDFDLLNGLTDEMVQKTRKDLTARDVKDAVNAFDSIFRAFDNKQSRSAVRRAKVLRRAF